MRAPRFAVSAVFVASALIQPLSAQAPDEHGHEDSSGDFVVSNLYLEPRYQFASASRRLTPYIAARVGKAMASFDESYGGTSNADGWLYGLGAGILWPLAKSVQVDAAAHYARVSHDYGSGDYSESEKGNLVGMRAGGADLSIMRSRVGTTRTRRRAAVGVPAHDAARFIRAIASRPASLGHQRRAVVQRRELAE